MIEVPIVIVVLAALIVIKAISGLRFPWETCECCGKKIRDHKEETSI
jgi:hypothetical protein